MTRATMAVLAAFAMVAGCATTPQGAAEQACMDQARAINVEFVRYNSTTPISDGFDVEMRLKDGLAREFNATCRYAGGKTSWAAPLPQFLPLYSRGGAGK